MSEGKPRPTKLARRVWIVILAVTVGPIVAALILRVFVVEAFKVPAGSMMPTLRVGDHMFVMKSSTVARKGEVFVFKFPENPAQAFVKRVVATGGDRLEIVDGRPVVNGTLAPQCYVGPFKVDQSTLHLYLERLDDRIYGVLHGERQDEKKCAKSADCGDGRACVASICVRELQGPFEAKGGEAWVLGDNRENSHDSPRWNGGKGRGVGPELAIGTASTIFFSTVPGRTWAPTQGLPTLDDANTTLQRDLDRCAEELRTR